MIVWYYLSKTKEESKMELCVIGNNGTCPQKDGACSSYLLILDSGERILIDAGNGSISKLWHICDPAFLDAIIISHLHFDHMADLFAIRYLLESRKYYGEPIDPIRLYIPRMPEWMETEIDGKGVFDIVPIREGNSEELFGGIVSFTLVEHLIESYAVRIEANNRTFVYSGDSGMCRQLIQAAADADMFLCESTFLENPILRCDHHMSVEQAAETARAAGVSKLLLTHFSEPQKALEYTNRAQCIFRYTEASAILCCYDV